jgi:hypothetical protein
LHWQPWATQLCPDWGETRSGCVDRADLELTIGTKLSEQTVFSAQSILSGLNLRAHLKCRRAKERIKKFASI